MKNIVRFYKEDDTVLGVFMNSLDEEKKGFYSCYARIGQHSTAHKDYVSELVPITHTDSKDILYRCELLANELRLIYGADNIEFVISFGKR